MEKSTKTGFIIKLSCETVQKLSEEDQKAKLQHSENSTNKEIDQKLDDTVEKTVQDTIICDLGPEVDTQDVDPSKKTEHSQSKSDDKSGAWDSYAQYVTYEGDQAIYTDPTSQQKYSWNNDDSSWKPLSEIEVPGRIYSYENDTHVYTEADGSKCFWDEQKKAWLPKVDEDFLALYQMSYGFVDNKPKEANEEKKLPQKKTEASVKRKNEAEWFEQSEEKNTKVYVSNLPLDLTEEEFVDFMQKCGLVERDPSSQKMKVKLYMDKEQNVFKGDALCTYIKIESVDLALKLLDGSELKGNKVKVERAHFQLKGTYNPALKPKKKRKKEVEKLKKMQQKLFDWRPEKFIGERSKHERIVIVKNLFQPSDFDKDVQLILDYQQDLRDESSKCGEVRKVVIFDRHPEGVAQITMKDPEEADAVIKLINGRWFGKRQITAETYDGRTKYRIAETDADINKRIDKWDKFLEGEDKDKLEKDEKSKIENKEKQEKDEKSEIVNKTDGLNTESIDKVESKISV